MGRRRKREQPGPAGFIVVDKPSGSTSHDIVDRARRWFGTRRVGHLGTLDPQATGVLPLAIREATKLVNYVPDLGKSYVGRVRLGVETDTLDAEGATTSEYAGPMPDEAAVREALAGFVGDIEQVPPMYSAVKKDGVPLHKLARRGEEVEREPKKVRIDALELSAFDVDPATGRPELELRVDCSAGTYVRVLAADLGSVLGCGAHLSSLRRTRSGPFEIGQAVAADVIDAEIERGEDVSRRLIDPARALGLPLLPLSAEGERRVLHGGDVSLGTALRLAPGDRALAVDTSDTALAIMELRLDRRMWPLRVLRSIDE